MCFILWPSTGNYESLGALHVDSAHAVTGRGSWGRLRGKRKSIPNAMVEPSGLMDKIRFNHTIIYYLYRIHHATLHYSIPRYPQIPYVIPPKKVIPSQSWGVGCMPLFGCGLRVWSAMFSRVASPNRLSPSVGRDVIAVLWLLRPAAV